jgi:hypothetical protein
MNRKRIGYLKYASQRFLVNLPYKAPIEAVQAGARSLREWCDCLNDARAFYGLTHEPLQPETELEFETRRLNTSESAPGTRQQPLLN